LTLASFDTDATLSAKTEKDTGDGMGQHPPMTMVQTRVSLIHVTILLALLAGTVLPYGAAAQEVRAVTLLKELEVKGRAPKTGYDRALFGPPWFDVDRNGCDTRNDILARDLVVFNYLEGRKGCIIAEGVLTDPYSGERIDFRRGPVTSLELQIDHVVSLSNAWQTGAFAWSEATRLSFANDPLNLLAVKGSLNTEKGDGDAATWLPPRKSYRCQFVARQIAVKSAYGLWVTRAERNSMRRILERCPDQRVPTR